MHMERFLLLHFPNALSIKLIVGIVGTFGDFRGGESGRLWAGKSDRWIVRRVGTAGCRCGVVVALARRSWPGKSFVLGVSTVAGIAACRRYISSTKDLF